MSDKEYIQRLEGCCAENAAKLAAARDELEQARALLRAILYAPDWANDGTATRKEVLDRISEYLERTAPTKGWGDLNRKLAGDECPHDAVNPESDTCWDCGRTVTEKI